MENEFNSHNKIEDRQNHTTEHILNQTMVRIYNCGRAIEAHIEAKKSKMDFALPKEPTEEEVLNIEKKVNEIIEQNLPVTMEYTTQSEAKDKYNLTRLPENATEKIRIVHIGDYDACPCIGLHVDNTKQIGTFKILSYSYKDSIWRVRWKIITKEL